MLLTLPNQSAFATGAVYYVYGNVKGDVGNPKVILNVTVGGKQTEVILDTGAPYLVCSPVLAELLAFDPITSLGRTSLRVRGFLVRGDLYRIDLSLLATEGENLMIEVLAFAPLPDELTNEFPSFLGFQGCLERMRFALDPLNDKFYFGAYG